MSQPDALAKLIADAGKAHLAPIGCRRIGRSRTWISDHRYWLIIVEFQPSGWQKGSYLHIGAMWLWRAQKGLAFHINDRPAGFTPFYSAQQFAPIATSMAVQAANEVQRLRSQFRSLQDIYRYLVEHTSEENWHIFHAAIAAGLVGEVDTSRRLFRIFSEMPAHGYQWAEALLERMLILASQLDHPQAFRSTVLATIQECRSLNGLKSDEHCLDFLDSPQVMRQ